MHGDAAPVTQARNSDHDSPMSSTTNQTPASSTGQSPREQYLSEFAAWMLAQPEERLAMIGVQGSVEEPMRLLRAYARENGLNL